MTDESELNKKMGGLDLEESKRLTEADDDLLVQDKADDDLLDKEAKDIGEEYLLRDKVIRLNYVDALKILEDLLEQMDEERDFEIPNLEGSHTVFSSYTLRIVRKINKSDRGLKKLRQPSKIVFKCLLTVIVFNLEKLIENKSNVYMYKRALYYAVHNKLDACGSKLKVTDTMIFEYIDALCCLLNCDRESFGVTACDTDSSFVGNIIVHRQDVSGFNRKLVEEDASCLTSPYRVNFSNITSVRPSEVPPRCILVVEKLTVFNSLCSSGIHHRIPCVIISGSGQPSVECRLFVKLVQKSLPDVPIFALVDCNPYGIDIFKVYKYGSMRLAFMSRNLTVACIRLIGLFHSDISDFGVKDKLLPLSTKDSSRLKNMMKEEWVQYEPEALKSLNRTVETETKADIEIFAEDLGYESWVKKIEEKIISILDS